MGTFNASVKINFSSKVVDVVFDTLNFYFSSHMLGYLLDVISVFFYGFNEFPLLRVRPFVSLSPD